MILMFSSIPCFTLYGGMKNGTLFSSQKMTIKGVDVPLLVLGDPAYAALLIVNEALS